jgi:hypothetical protein
MNRSRYPENWEAIALACKTDANWQCQWCQRPCRRPDEDWGDFADHLEPEWRKDFYSEIYDEELGSVVIEKRSRFILTTAHLDHDPENPNARLAALCSGCHCRYDLRQIPRKQQLQKERFGQLTLNLNLNLKP